MTLIAPTIPFIRDRFTWLAYLLLAYYAYLQASFGPISPFLRAELKLSYTVGGLHLSAFALGLVLAGLLGDRGAARWGRAQVLWGGALGLALGTLGLVTALHVVLTLSSALLMGFAGSLVLVMVQATLSDRHGPRRAVALTEANLAASVSATLVPLCVGAFERAGLGWRAALFVPLALLLFLLVGRLWRIPVPQPRLAGAEEPGRACAPARLPRLFWFYWVVLLLAVSAEWSLVLWSPDFLEKVTGLERVTAVTAMSLFFSAAIVGRLIISRLARRVASQQLLLLALILTTAGFGLFWLVNNTTLTLVGLFVTGLGVAALFPLTLATATNVAEAQANAASARVALGAGLAMLLAPLTLGWAADQIDIRQAFALVGGLLFTATAVTLSASSRWRRARGE